MNLPVLIFVGGHFRVSNLLRLLARECGYLSVLILQFSYLGALSNASMPVLASVGEFMDVSIL